MGRCRLAMVASSVPDMPNEPLLILAGKSRPPRGQPCSGGSSSGSRSDTLHMRTRVSYEAAQRVLRAAHRR